MFFKRGANGVTRIVRDSYRKKPLTNTVAGKQETWWSISAKVKARDQHRCVQCKTPENPQASVYHHVHHIKELSRGGQTTMLNLITLCERCHKLRHKHL